MKQIENKIKEKRESGVYEKLLNELLTKEGYKNVNSDIYNDLLLLKELAKVDFNYQYTSHRLFFGGFIIMIKKFFRFLYKISLKQIYQTQESFNSLTYNILCKIVDKLEKLENK
jgi:hypothetical protein